MLIAQRLLFRSHPIVSYLWRDRVLLVCDTRYQDHYSPQSLLAEREYGEWIARCVRNEECTYVNVGAHIGGFDVAASDEAKSIPQAISIELNPRTFAALKYNLAINNFHTVRPLNAGIAGEPGFIDFSPSTCSLADSIFSQTATPEANAARLPLLTLEQILERFPFSNPVIDLLKLDCEGAEYGIIRLSPASLLKRFRFIIMEIHAQPPGESLEALQSKLRACGFQIEAERQEPQLLFWKNASTLLP